MSAEQVEDAGTVQEPEDAGTVQEPEEPEGAEAGQEPEEPSDTVSRAELDRVIRQRDKLKAKLRELERGQPGKDGQEPEQEPDASVGKFVRLAARTVLKAEGVPKEHMGTVLDALGLDNLDAGADEEDLADEITERLSALRTALAVPEQRRRAPRVDTRDRGGASGDAVTDPDRARRLRFLTGGR
ncbi:MAG TPA: hypothetical protein VFU47_12880 [Armatimonadota bacterium]|nr:hypothetical protein [Armatimonadota bacterium]